MKTPALGAIASTPDYRDQYLAGTIGNIAMTVTPPASFDTDLSAVEVMDQEQTPACVSHAWALMMKLYWYRKTGEWIDFSPRFLDILSWEDDLDLEDGRRPRTVAKISTIYGCCTTKTLPNDTDLPLSQYRDKNKITQAAYAEALKYRIPGYISVPLDKYSFRTAIQLYGAISTLFAIGNEFWTPSWQPKDINPLRIPKEIISGHQIVVKGWKDLYNRLRNSWGKEWNQNGEGDYGPNAWRPYIFEGWVPAEIPKDVALFLKTLPSPAQFKYDFASMPTLTKGMVNDNVKFAQIALMIKGHLAPVTADELGIYGNKTAAAVLAYQKAKGISPTAADTIGSKTRAALAKDFPL